MKSNWRIIIKGALLGGLVGPSIGVLLSVSPGILWRLGEPESRVDLSLPGLLAGISLFWLYAMVFFGPVGGLLGAFGTWLMLQAHRRAVSLRVLWTIGVGAGALLGALCPGLSMAIVSTEWSLGFADPRNPYTVLGGGVGAIVGCLVTTLVVRSAPSRHSR